jgi:hypothetical protein
VLEHPLARLVALRLAVVAGVVPRPDVERVPGHPRGLHGVDAAAGDPLPACRALLMVMWFPPPAMGEYETRVDTADRALTAALDELAAWRRD